MLTKELEETLGIAVDEAVKRRHEYVTLEHLLYALLSDSVANDVLNHCGANFDTLRKGLDDYFNDVVERMPEHIQLMPELTSTFQGTIQYAMLQAEGSGQKAVDGGNILAALYQAEQSYAVYLLLQQGVTRLDVLNYIAHGISKIEGREPLPEGADEEFEGQNAPRKNRSKVLRSNSSPKPPKDKLIQSSDAKKKLNERFRYFADDEKIIRFTSVNRGSVRPHWQKVWR